MSINPNKFLPIQKKILFFISFSLSFIVGLSAPAHDLIMSPVAEAADRDVSKVEIIKHEYHLDEDWDKVGKTKYIWKVTIRNHSNVRKRVFAYVYLLDEEDVPLARNVANRMIDAHQTTEIVADSYIMTHKVPHVVRSRIKLKVGFPN